MSDPLRDVQKGDGPGALFNATRFNIVNEAARHYLRNKLGKTGPQSGAPLDFPVPHTVVHVRYTGASIDTLAPGSVLAYGDLLTPLTDAKRWTTADRPAFDGLTPSDADAPFVVTKDSIKGQEIGRAVLAGLAVVRVLVNDAGHDRAVPVVGETGHLETAASGGVPLIHVDDAADPPDDPDVRWGFVLLPSGGSGDGGGGDAAGDCDALWDLHEDNCLLATTSAGSGRCAGISADTHNLTYDGTLERWVSPLGDPYTVDTGSGRLHFWVDDTVTPKRPRLQLVGDDFDPSYEFDFDGCTGGGFRFIGRGTDVCSGTQTSGCGKNTFAVVVTCVTNTNSGWTESGWYCVAVTGCNTTTETQVCVEYTTDPGCGVVICSGPHADEATCEAACREVNTGTDCSHCTDVTPAAFDTSTIAGTTSSKGCTDCETVNAAWTLTQDAKNPCLWLVTFDAGDQYVQLTRAAGTWTLTYNNGTCNSGWTSTIAASDSCLEELVFSSFTQTGTNLCSVPSGPITVTPSLA